MRTATKTGALAAAIVFAIAWPVAADTSWPASLNPIGDGYPVKGSVCRQLEQSAAVASYINENSVLVGCPGSSESVFVRKYLAKTGGNVVGELDGIALISISRGQQAAMSAKRDADAKAVEDAFKAMGQLRCTLTPAQRLSQCDFGIARKGGLTVIRIKKPDSSSREIYFANDKVVGADVDKASGIAKRRVVTTREVDLFMVAVGDERYEIPAAAVGRADR